MQDEWIIDVLTDLKRFAQHNAMPQLCAALDNTLEVARRELVCREDSPGDGGEELLARVRGRAHD